MRKFGAILPWGLGPKKDCYLYYIQREYAVRRLSQHDLSVGSETAQTNTTAKSVEHFRVDTHINEERYT